MCLFKSLLKNEMLRALIIASSLTVPAMAYAAPAIVTANVNVRSGPGTSYVRLAALPAGIRVDAGPCRGSWCQINSRGYRGWVSARFVSFGTYARGPAYYPQPVYPSTSTTTVIIGGGTGWGPGWGSPYGGRPYWGPRIGHGVYPGWRPGYNPYGRPAWNSHPGSWNPAWGHGPAYRSGWSQPPRFGGNRVFGHIGFENTRPYNSGR